MLAKKVKDNENEKKQQGKKTENAIGKIIDNYKNLEKALVNQLSLEIPNHHPTTGTYREAVWKDLFEQIIPRKFCIAQGVFIIDSHGKISAEVDLVIFDEQYTPYIFNYGKIKFIPIEAVAVVIQCKSYELKPNEIKKWVESIEELRTSLDSVARVMSGLHNNRNGKCSQSSTHPIKILCSNHHGKINSKIIKSFDLLLSLGDNLSLKITIPEENKNYYHWHRELNHYCNDKYSTEDEDPSIRERTLGDLKVVDNDGTEIAIMSLTFQLNQMLMLINNPMPFPHRAYVEMFNNLDKNENKTSGGDNCAEQS